MRLGESLIAVLVLASGRKRTNRRASVHLALPS